MAAHLIDCRGSVNDAPLVLERDCDTLSQLTTGTDCGRESQGLKIDDREVGRGGQSE